MKIKENLDVISILEIMNNTSDINSNNNPNNNVKGDSAETSIK